MRARFVNESLLWSELKRQNRSKIDLLQVDYAYHWMTEGKFFDACYADYKGDSSKYCLKRGVMPDLPAPTYRLGYDSAQNMCLTVDPTYYDPCFNEDGLCVVLNMQKLIANHKIEEDLTDNGEAEFRTKLIPNWPNYLIEININEKSYLKGIGWEEFRFRAIKDWIPEELKSKVVTFKNHRDLEIKRKISNTYNDKT